MLAVAQFEFGVVYDVNWLKFKELSDCRSFFNPRGFASVTASRVCVDTWGCNVSQDFDPHTWSSVSGPGELAYGRIGLSVNALRSTACVLGPGCNKVQQLSKVCPTTGAGCSVPCISARSGLVPKDRRKPREASRRLQSDRTSRPCVIGNRGDACLTQQLRQCLAWGR